MTTVTNSSNVSKNKDYNIFEFSVRTEKGAVIPLLDMTYKNDCLNLGVLKITKDRIIITEVRSDDAKMVYFLADAKVGGKKYKAGDFLQNGWSQLNVRETAAYKKGTLKQKFACYRMILELLTAHRSPDKKLQDRIEIAIDHLIKENLIK